MGRFVLARARATGRSRARSAATRRLVQVQPFIERLVLRGAGKHAGRLRDCRRVRGRLHPV